MANSRAATESTDVESRRRVHHWNGTEDHKLRQLVQEHGPRNWREIAEHMDGRTGKSCRLRWVNHLDPKLNRNPFTKEEEERLIAAHNFHGAKWARIARHFPGRTDNFVKNGWHVAIARKRREQYRRIMQGHNNGALAESRPNRRWFYFRIFGSTFPLPCSHGNEPRVDDASMNENFGGLFDNSSSSPSSAVTKIRASSSSEGEHADEDSNDDGGRKEIPFYDFLGVGDQ